MENKFTIKCRGIILHKDKLLVVRHTRTNFVALPGGHLEHGEDPKECLKRELIEELGVEPEISRLLYINTFEDKVHGQFMEFFFEVSNGLAYVDIEKNSRTHAFELAEITWISPTEDVHLLPKQFSEDFKSGKILSDKPRFIKI